jgi:hypothetical protein
LLNAAALTVMDVARHTLPPNLFSALRLQPKNATTNTQDIVCNFNPPAKYLKRTARIIWIAVVYSFENSYLCIQLSNFSFNDGKFALIFVQHNQNVG